jgi:tetratricopeptide (TPR) repeat protein
MTKCLNCTAWLDESDRFCRFCGSFNSTSRTTNEDLEKLWQAAHRAYQRGDHANGVTLFKQIIYYAPNTLEAYYYLADCYTNLDQIDQAVATMRQAQALQPDSCTICYNLGMLEKRNGRLFEARQHVQDALRLLETDARVTNRDELRAQMQKTLAEMS